MSQIISNHTKAVYLLERTKDAESHIIGFYSTEALAIAAVKRHVEKTVDEAVVKSALESDSPTIGIYIQEGFMISRNEVEVDAEVEFDKIEDTEEFHIAEDLGDVQTVAPRVHPLKTDPPYEKGS